jgi:hypothetical protein
MLVRHSPVFHGGNGIATVPRIAAMKVALWLAVHECPNILPHDAMTIS